MRKAIHFLLQPTSIAPLVSFRVLFGGIMVVSILRFLLKGWVHLLYIEPEFYFSYWGFEWVKPLGATGMYLVFALMAVSALGICLGAFYRISTSLFFLSFTYVELLDKTNYLNHYYFVSVVAFLLMLVPAHRSWSVDVWRKPQLRQTEVSQWAIAIFKVQLGMVYFFAGVAKLNSDWLFRAMPMAIWLPAKSYLPVVGGLLKLKWVAYLLSWAGAVYDLCIPFLLLWKKTRGLAYVAVVAFHLITWLLFPIGMFPFIMILSTLIFFPASWHEKMQLRLSKKEAKEKTQLTKPGAGLKEKLVLGLLVIHFALQVLLPFRYALYPGDLFWTEQGFRFSWRVMLMEKAGTSFFYIIDRASGRELEVDNRDFLTPNQEKMMATQPDMILQYADYLAEVYANRGMENPGVRAEVYVTLNGSGSRLFIDPKVDLTQVEEGWANKTWIQPFE